MGCSWDQEKNGLKCMSRRCCPSSSQKDHVEVQTGKAKPWKAAYFHKGHNPVSLLPKFLSHNMPAMPRQRDMSSSLCFYLKCAVTGKPHKGLTHSIKRHSKESEAQRRNGGKKLFSISPLPPTPGQAFPRCTLRPSSSTPFPLVPSSAAQSFNQHLQSKNSQSKVSQPAHQLHSRPLYPCPSCTENPSPSSASQLPSWADCLLW